MALPKETPVLIAPAMNTNMWENPIVQKNVDALSKDKKYKFMGTREGVLACRDEGYGKIAENKDILEEAQKILGKK
jgi:phosphopantothenoylcysteine synthetase/decarboxylase